MKESLPTNSEMSESSTKSSELVNRIIAQEIPRRYKLAIFDDFRDDFQLPVMSDSDFCFITGATGTGKTHLAVALLRSALLGNVALPVYKNMKDRRCAAMVSAPNLLRHIRSCYQRDSREREEEIFEFYRHVPHLILDDLGAEKISDWSISTLYSIIAARSDDMKPLIVTSNLTLDQIQEWEPRIASRLASGKVIKLSGKDRRLQ